MDTEHSPQELIAIGMPLVRAIAHDIHRRIPMYNDLDDLIQWGSMGLLDAIKKYMPNSENTFKTYARHRIRGAILDGLRDSDATSRSARKHQRLIENSKKDFYLDNGRDPSEDELAKVLDIKVSALRKIDAKTLPIKSMSMEDVELFSKDDRRALIVALKNKKSDARQKLEVAENLKKLVDNQYPIHRACFLLLNIWGLTMKEIAELFGLSESRISQIISSIKMVSLDGGKCEL